MPEERAVTFSLAHQNPARLIWVKDNTMIAEANVGLRLRIKRGSTGKMGGSVRQWFAAGNEDINASDGK